VVKMTGRWIGSDWQRVQAGRPAVKGLLPNWRGRLAETCVRGCREGRKRCKHRNGMMSPDFPSKI
jgi:hypothetical protein